MPTRERDVKCRILIPETENPAKVLSPGTFGSAAGVDDLSRLDLRTTTRLCRPAARAALVHLKDWPGEGPSPSVAHSPGPVQA